jgi:hypothetical protein
VHKIGHCFLQLLRLVDQSALRFSHVLAHRSSLLQIDLAPGNGSAGATSVAGF